MYVAVVEIAAGLLRFRGFGFKEVLVVVDGCGGEGLVDFTSTQGPFPRSVGVSPTFELQLHSGAVGEVGDRFRELQRLEVHDQLNGVPTARTAMAVVEAFVRRDAKGWSFLLVVRVGAEAGEPGALTPEGRELGGYLDDVGRLSDLFYA